MVVKRLLLLVLVFLVIFSVKSDDEYVAVQGYSFYDSTNSILLNISSSVTLKEDPLCILLKNINHLSGLSILRRGYISDLPNLEEITIKDVKEIEPGAFSNVPKLTIVTITAFGLNEISEGVFNYLDIVEIDLLLGSSPTIAAGAFDNMPRLERIGLNFNNLTEWNSDWFFNTPSLKDIGFFDNKIRDLPHGAFKNIKNEEAEINLFSNEIRTVGKNLFGKTKKIKSLYLSKNRIQDFGEDVLGGVEDIKFLHLISNKIECFHGNLSKIFVARTTFLNCNPLDVECGEDITKWMAHHPSHDIKLKKESVTCEI